MRHTVILAAALLSASAAFATDRAIPLSPAVSMSWGAITPGGAVEAHRNPAVGFWQRASGAKPGVGIVFTAAMEFQLPETVPSLVRSATFQFSGKQSQCSGAEAVVVDVFAYPANGRGEVADATAGARVAQMRADCATNPAFNQPIDVTSFVRQLAVPSGIRHVGFNIRKANNRQGPGLFALSAGTLTVVLADQDLAHQPAAPAQPMAHPGVAVLSENFESPASSNYTVVRAGQSFTTLSRTWNVEAGSVDIVNTRVRTEAAAFDGSQAIDLAGSPGAGVLSTRLATKPGQQYLLTFHYARNNGIGGTPARARVEVMGTAPLLQGDVQHESPRLPFNAYQRFRGTFQADGASATLRFTSLNAGNAGIMLDAVSVAAVPTTAAAAPPIGDSTASTLPQSPAPQTAAGPNGLIKALGTLARGGGTKVARDQAKGEALDGIANLPPTSAGPTAPNQPTQ